MPSVLDVTAAKVHLNLTVATYDAELQTFIDAAESFLARFIGPLQATAATRRVCGDSAALVLPRPVISLTSITPDTGAALTLSDLYLNPDTGVITFNSGAWFYARYYTVVYQAGRTVSATVNADILHADKELVRHLWVTQRGSGGRPGSSQSEPVVGPLYTLPPRVQEVIAAQGMSGSA